MAQKKVQTMKLQTYNNEQNAIDNMRTMNRAYQLAGNKKNICVMVEGPNDEEWTLMDVKDAIEAEMPYSWEI